MTRTKLFLIVQSVLCALVAGLLAVIIPLALIPVLKKLAKD